jgi:hypothetical protein
VSSPETPPRAFTMERPAREPDPGSTGTASTTTDSTTNDSGHPQSGQPQAGQPQAGQPQAGHPQAGHPQQPAGSPRAARSAQAAPGQSAHRPRRVRLGVARVDPWSVMKLSFLLSIALGIILVIAVAVLWYVLDAMGVFTAVSGPVSEVSEVDLLEYTARNRVLGIAVMVGVVNVVLITALSTLAAFLYNLSSSLVGGLQVTLSDDS